MYNIRIRNPPRRIFILKMTLYQKQKNDNRSKTAVRLLHLHSSSFSYTGKTASLYFSTIILVYVTCLWICRNVNERFWWVLIARLWSNFFHEYKTSIHSTIPGHVFKLCKITACVSMPCLKWFFVLELWKYDTIHAHTCRSIHGNLS